MFIVTGRTVKPLRPLFYYTWL